MEILFGLMAIVLAAIALWRAKAVGESNEQLTDRLTQLELEVYRLRQKQTTAAPVTPAATSTAETRAEPLLRALAREPETPATPPPPVIKSPVELPPIIAHLRQMSPFGREFLNKQ